MSRAAALLTACVLALVTGCATPAAEPSAAASAPPAPPPAFNVLGREDAPVTIIEFTDLQCPYCARHAAQVFPRLKHTYIDTGRLRYTSRDLPLPFHSFALPAAVAARCAGQQGRFWEYREALFAAQGELGREPYGRIAGDLGLDAARLDACRGDGREAANVRADAELARTNGIGSTPAFVIGRVVDGEFQGEMLSGAQPYEVFASKIDALLEAAAR